ncbi:MAG TPA: hypothetical protein VFC19_04400, partial [Candidatus Limnocylindrales bacterium]|nr:hypothetical protein [Candidatus Limnocylindrales bacterium]
MPAVWAWVRKSVKLVTVTVGPPDPPVVPPACVAQPMMPPGGVGLIDGEGEVGGDGEFDLDGDGDADGDEGGDAGGELGLGPAASVT